MNNKFLFIERKKIIAISIVVILIVAGLIFALLYANTVEPMEKVASTEEIKAQENIAVTGVSFYKSDGILYGDANGDGEVDESDATLIAQHSAQLAEITEENKIKADVDGSGDITSGDASLVAQYADRIITIFPVQVKEENKLDNQTIIIEKGNDLQLYSYVLPENATNKNVTWTSSDPTVATIDENGLLSTIKAGKTTITVTTVDGEYTASCTVIVPGIEIYVNDGILYGDANGDGRVDGTDATLVLQYVSNNGTITEENKIKADVDGDGNINSYDASLILEYTVHLRTIFPVQMKEEHTMEKGNTLQLYSYILPEDATNKNVTWTSSEPSVATVDNNGFVTAIKAGKTDIIATTQEGNYTDMVHITVVGQEDTTAPTVTFDPDGNDDWDQGPTIDVTVEDEGSGVDETSLKYKWILASNTTQPAEKDFTETFQNNRYITLSDEVEGEYKLWILAKDNAGNTTITSSNIVYADGKGPQATFSKNGGTIEPGESITVTITDEGSGISGLSTMANARYKWIEADASLWEGEGEWYSTNDIEKLENGYRFNAVVPMNLELGKEYIIVLSEAEDVIDDYGNEVEPRSSLEYTYVDTKAPTAPIVTIISGTQNERLEYTTEVVVQITQGTDNGIGVNYTEVSIQYNDGKETTETKELITEQSKEYTLENNGTYTIVATTYDKAGNKTSINPYTIVINKETQKVTGVELDKETLNMYVGEMDKLTATVFPNNATNQKITWESSDEEIISVDKNGYVKALKEGTAEIMVTTEDGSYTAKCTITVQKDPETIFTSDVYYILNTDKTILNVSPSTTLAEFKANITSNVEYKVVKENEEEIKEEELVATGMKVILETDEGEIEYLLAVKGDINGDGECDISDLSKLKKHIIQEEVQTEMKKVAADLNLDGESDITDLSRMVRYIIGLVEL